MTRVDPLPLLGLALIVLVGLPPVSPLLQARLPLHVLVQYPAIIAGGACIGIWLAGQSRACWSAAPSLLMAAPTLAFWMLPRWVDAGLADSATDAMKVLTLALLAGVPLGWGWMQAGLILRGLLIAHAAVMFAVMGWLLLVVPDRLCNAYLITDQRMLGRLLLIVALGLVLGSVIWAIGGGAQRYRRARLPSRSASLVRES